MSARNSSTTTKSDLVNKLLTNKQEVESILLEETVVVGLRVPVLIKKLYDGLDRRSKRWLKDAFCGLVLSLARGEVSVTAVTDKQTVIYNVNVNIQESRSEVKVDLQPIVDFLSQLVEPPRYVVAPPPWVRNSAKRLLEKLSKLRGS